MSEEVELRPLVLGEVFWAWHTGMPKRARMMRRLREPELVRVNFFDTGNIETLQRVDCYGDDEIPRLFADVEREIRDLKSFRLFVMENAGGTPAVPGRKEAADCDY